MAIDKNDPEVQALISAEMEKLSAKNKELLSELKEARKGKTIDSAEYQAALDAKELAETKLAEAQKALKTANGEAEKHKKLYEAELGVTHKLVAKNGLTAELIKNKVLPEHMETLIDANISKINIKVDGDNRVAMVGDKQLSDYMGEYFKDKGKHYVAAPINNGGGANGGAQGGGKPKTMTRVAFEAIDAVAKAAFIKEGGTLTQ